MGHCISVYLIKREELRNESIDNIIDGETLNIKFTQLGGNILATTYIPNVKEFREGKTITKISTDYFGGMGDQSANLWVNSEFIYDKCDEYDNISPINYVLRMMGVIRNGSNDEFDTIGLGNYRSNDDFK